MHGVSELLRRRRRGIVHAKVRVVGAIAVRAPVALALAGRRIEHDDALVAVAVGDVRLVGFSVDRDLGEAVPVEETPGAFDNARPRPLLVFLGVGHIEPPFRRSIDRLQKMFLNIF